MTRTSELSLGSISVDATDTDEKLAKKAKKHLPTALRKVGVKMGEENWKTLEKELGSSSIFKFDRSSSAQAAHVKSVADQFVSRASGDTKRTLEKSILEQITAIRDEKKETKS